MSGRDDFHVVRGISRGYGDAVERVPAGSSDSMLLAIRSDLGNGAARSRPCHGVSGSGLASANCCDRAILVAGLPVLAQFRFSNHPGYLDFKADDGRVES